ncbi:cytochrome P450 4C1-like [Cylas formicarius]|uniref:cytochrome P450 4C1-like n=1 Tax=Cylas formicarius TaxID=197179 RepID=UPI0029586673|nr:cytochrome P450 4C1-like [Cylas formicarius]XP_060532912.1 cytochrome P450 4C1-like [Cylas formicarius]XP_060532913.1 cytochrome P450 4C1-like [Cylas formicarius]
MTQSDGDAAGVSAVLVTVSLIFASAVFLILKSLYDKRRIFKFAAKIKGFRFYPVVGNGFHIIGKNVFDAVQTIIKDHGLPCNMWVGHDYNYVTADPQEVKIVLNHPNSFDKMRIYDNFKLAFENSLLLAPVDLWKKNRKFCSKSFSQPILNNFVEYFYRKSCTLLEVLRDSDDKDKFEVFERYTFDSFCESIIGLDYNLQVKPKVRLVEWIGELQSIGGRRLITSYYYPLPVWLFSGEGRRAYKLLRNVMTLIYGVIRDKRRAFKENPICVDANSPGLTLLDAMLHAEGEKFSDKQIFEEMFLFTTAATDTSGYTLAYIFTLLGMHADVQERVYKEVMCTVGRDRPIYYEDLPNLKYTERAILESMRILPVTPFIGRLCTGDIDLGTKIVPEGSNVFISVIDLHRDPKHWPDPLKYDPDRFLPEETAKREPYAYIPFSGGCRNCIGKPYALMLMKTAVANVVRNYEIFSKYRSVSELRLTSCITMKTVDPIDCRFKWRAQE